MGKWKDYVAEVISRHPKGKPLTESGAEVPDPVPMEPPVGYKKQPSMFDTIRAMIREERMKALEEEGFETPEDADDFDIDDEVDPSSPYEHDFDHVGDPAELQRLRDAIDSRERELRGPPVAPSNGRTGAGGAPPPTDGGPGAQPPEVK